ncbi:aldehyde dehydrogenase (NAD+) [Ruminiclostridium sufflavum DSM 19573]|uniref:Aldehyde dehydrogenase n=2 Tax=Ruminiclostridium TaxID=1508657 RepID=A0A318XRR0_9FIRM|nr:aldehyde dehydrogenase (NAD+) [Ruminiclostridium sufflavum DSM 19573]
MTEVGFTLNEIDFMIKNIRRLAKYRRVKTPLMLAGGSSHIAPEPYGTVLIIGPWNYPFQLVMLPLAGAIAAGNCAVVKPSELSPNVAGIITKIINKNFDNEYIFSAEGGIEMSEQLLAQKFDYIFYTGSTTVGRIVMEAAAKNLTPVTLELGGKSPCIVDKDTNLDNAARRIAWGKLLNCGQTCVAPDYLFVHKEIRDEFIKKLINTSEAFYGSNPIKNEQYSKIINERHFNRLLSLIDKQNIIYGGNYDKERLKISPTVIYPVTKDSKIMQDEIFGPVMPIMEYENIDEVIGYINDRPKPLALYFFSKDKGRIRRVLKETSSGGVCINDTVNHIASAGLPFGGVGDSGMGSYHGRATFDTFSHKKSILKSQLIFDLEMKYPPYDVSEGFIKKVFKYLLH